MSNTSRLARIAHWINTYFKLSVEEQIDKNHVIGKDVKEWVDEEYEDGRVTVLTDDELLDMIRKSCDNHNIEIG